MKNLYLFIGLFLCLNSLQAQTWQSTNAVASSGAYYITSTANVGETIYANGAGASAFNNFVFSTDRGETWTASNQLFIEDQIATLTGAHGRLYAAVRNVSQAYSYNYSTDNGVSWTEDNAGLPEHWSGTGKAAFKLKAMHNDQIIAFDATQLYVKTTSDASWTNRNINFILVDICLQGNDWFATAANAIYKSSDDGQTWVEAGTSGLPSGFQGNIIASNGEDRLYVSAAPAQGGSDIYFSSNGGESWELTNSTGIYTHANPWVAAIYAVNDYVFASINPDGGNFNDTPKFLISNSATPNFEAGAADGFPEGYVVAPIPIYYHIDEQLFAMYADVYTSTPGFDGSVQVAEQFENKVLSIYPNPCQNILHLDGELLGETYRILNNMGQVVLKGELSFSKQIALSNLPSGCYHLIIEEESIPFIKE
jgi:hypothetical protein